MMAGVRASSEGGLGRLSCQDLSAHIWGVVSDASCQRVPVLVPVFGTLLAVSEPRVTSEPSCTQREVTSEHTSHPGHLI